MKFTRHRVSLKPARNVENWDSIRHRELEKKIRRAIHEIGLWPGNGIGYVTYVIKERVRQVGKPDMEIPFYVGQTGDLKKRALQHFQCAGQPNTNPDNVYWHMHQILKDYRVPVFDILERSETLAASLLSESKWVQRLTHDGFKVWNQWTEHQPGKFSDNVPAKRLWAFTLRQALMDDLRLSVACRSCQFALDLPLDGIAQVAPLETKLVEIRKTFRCPQCGGSIV